MPAPKITFYVDIISPFCYLAFHILRTSPIFQGCEITYVPVLLGGIMIATGNRPPLEIKNKASWIARERLRWARLFSIPIASRVPTPFPIRTLDVQRALTAVTLVAPERIGDAIAALYEEFLVKLGPIAKPEECLAVLRRVLEEDVVGKVEGLMTSPEVKKLLTANTQRAVDDGAFGLPYYVATCPEGKTECFWGFDHINQVALHLGLDTLRPENANLRAWKAML